MSLTVSQAEDFWRTADTDNSGYLTMQELWRALKKNNVADATVAGIFLDLDDNEDSKVTKREFMDELTKKQRRSETLKGLWKKYDTDNSGELSRGEVMALIKDFFPPEQKSEVIGRFFSYCNLDKDGIITKKEFDTFFG